MRKFVFVLTLTSLFILALTGAAFAASHWDGAGDRTMEITASNCYECHTDAALHTYGPHGNYASGTDKCQACHDVHGKGENPALLMGATLTAACQYCHDLTATWAGPYNMSGLTSVGSAHRVVGIDVYSYVDSEGHLNDAVTAGLSTIPGGNGYDGSEGSVTNDVNKTTLKDPILSGAVFTCNSCHTPHGVRTVDKYLGESFVKKYKIGATERLYLSTRILRNSPNRIGEKSGTSLTAGEYVYNYSSQWCLGCHEGRDDLQFEYTHNHPVNKTAPGYRLIELAIWNQASNTEDNGWGAPQWINGSYASQSAFYTAVKNGDVPEYVTIGAGGDFDKDPRTNQQFAMTPGDFMNNNTPRWSATGDGFDPIDRGYVFGLQDGVYIGVNDENNPNNGPACQQCHGSARNVEAKWVQQFGNAGNPQRASFPHVSENKALLVETADDFCTNCHDPNILP